MKVNVKRIIIIGVSVQTILCVIETVRSIQCHIYGSLYQECWPWFFIFTLNIPASAVFEQVYGILVTRFEMHGFAATTLMRCSIYVLGGSVWWCVIILIVSGPVKLLKRISQAVKRRNARG